LLRLERQFDLLRRPTVLQWLRHTSNLGAGSFRVLTVLRCRTSYADMLCSVPQGSVLGPRLFILLMADFALADTAKAHAHCNVTIHSFADDTQLYSCCNRNEVASAIVRLQQCISLLALTVRKLARIKHGQDSAPLGWCEAPSH